jgi:hypothetical protein
VAAPVNVRVVPSQIGFGVAEAVTADGIGLIETDAVFAAVADPHALLAVNE